MHGAAGGCAAPQTYQTRPQVWREYRDGVAALVGRTGITGVQVLGRGGKVYMVDSTGTPAVYDCLTKELSIGAATIMGGAGTVGGNLWAHSSGALFCDAKLTADTRYSCYRSTDNGATWAKVLDYSTFAATEFGSNSTASDTMIKRTEADNGWVFGCFYAAGANGANINRMIRSRDAGATWEWITDLPLAAHPRHMHEVRWDRYRNVLWASGGDHGGIPTDCPLYYSTDYGSTWTAFTGTRQSTGVIPTPSGLYVCIDDNDRYDIDYYAGTTLPDLLSATKVIAFNPLDGHLSGVNTTYESGFAWWGWYDAATDLVYAAYGAASGTTPGAMLAGGTDGGSPWVMIDYDYSATGAATSYSDNGTANPPNTYDREWDGWHYTTPTRGAWAAWRVQRHGDPIYVSRDNGRDYYIGSQALPRATIPDLPFPEPRRIVLLDDYDTHAYLGSPNTLIDRNGFTLGAAAGGTVTDSQTLIGISAPPTNWSAVTALSGALTWNATAPDSGTCVLSALPVTANAYAYAARASLSYAQGTEVWISFEAWLAEAALTGSIQILEIKNGMQLVVAQNTAANDRDNQAHVVVQTWFPSAAGIVSGDGFRRIDFPLQQWVQILVRTVLRNGTTPQKGEWDWWINGRLAGSLRGCVPSTSVTLTDIYFGAKNRATASATRSLYLRNAKIGYGGNILATGNYDLRAGSGIKVLPEGIVS